MVRNAYQSLLLHLAMRMTFITQRAVDGRCRKVFRACDCVK